MNAFFVSALLFTLAVPASCNKSSGPTDNHKPLVTLESILIKANPFTYTFIATASDVDGDPLKYSWNFGEGTSKDGNSLENFSYPEDKIYTVKVTVNDGKSAAVEASITINTKTVSIVINPNEKFQIMEGFGGFGAQDVYWSNGPFTSAAYIDRLVNELGVTIIRDELPTSFEIINDNADPLVTDLTKYNLNNDISGHHKPLGARLSFFRDAKAAGVEKFIVSVWSAPPWMKTNNRIDNGTNQNSAPVYNPTPTSSSNQLRTDMYEEFAEMCAAYIKIFKQEVGIDLYALGIQNEPRFSQSYQSTLYSGTALRDLLKVVGKRLKNEGLTTKLFLPEDIGWLGGVEGMIKPTLDDPMARQYADIVAVHGYDLDGVTAGSPNAQTWQTMYGWGAAYGKPLWMTETSGFKNDWSGAMSLSKAMYTAIRHGHVSAWVFWTSSTSTLDEYSLMSSAGEKSKRFFVSKNFYKFIRPGAQRIAADAATDSKVYPLAFTHSSRQSTTLVLINDNTEPRAVKLSGSGLPSDFIQYHSSINENWKDNGTVKSDGILLLQPQSVTTLYRKN